MNYFVDFEATQFSNEIISIGCVREDGTEFYSEVRARKKITSFITSLTGITDEQNKMAESSDEVFSHFFDWLMENADERAIFYCYGNTDINFIKKNLTLTKNLKAQAALSLMGMSLYDYSAITKAHFGLIKNISLIKLVAYYRNVEDIEQTHNALEDARFLKEVYDNVSNEKEVKGHPFPEYETELPNQKEIPNEIGKSTNKSPRNILKSLRHTVEMYDLQGEILERVFESIGEARKYIIDNMGKIDQKRTDKAKVENKIINANNKKISYTGHMWKILILDEDKNDSTT